MAVLSGPNPNDEEAIPFEVIKIIKDDRNRRGNGIAFDDDGNMYISGGETLRNTFNVHVNNGSGPVDHEDQMAQPDFISDVDARFVKPDGMALDYRPDNPDNLHIGKDGKFYVATRFGHRNEANAATGPDGDGPGMALVYEIDTQAGDLRALTPPTILAQGDDMRGPGLFLHGNRIIDFIPIFASDLAPAGVSGDYNGNGIVDAADYTYWRDRLGQSTTLPNSDPADNDGVVTGAEYTYWVSRFGGDVRFR